MKPKILLQFLLALALLSVPCIYAADGLPAACTLRIMDVADFKQSNPKAGFTNGGSEFCAPTSLSDWLMYYAAHGYPKLVEKGADPESTQIDLIKTLSTKDYLNTNPEIGTDPSQITKGLEKYVVDHGYKVKRLEYQGWRPCSGKYNMGVSTPKLEWLKSGCKEKSCTLINYGWYQYDESSDTYKRTGGHWVALVGYGKDGAGKANPNAIIVHDPLPRFSADAVVPVYVALTKLESGTLSGKYKGLPQEANGYYYFDRFSNGERTKEMKSGYGIIDCGIVLELE